MLVAPYLIIGFSVTPGVPNADAIRRQLEQTIPWSGPPLPLGPEDVFAMEVTTANMFAKWQEVSNFLNAFDRANGNVVRWFAQVCPNANIAGG